MEEETIKFAYKERQNSIIKVIGVGGGGGNAVSYMYEQGIHNVDFIICNTDAQALDKSPVPIKIHLGKGQTEGLGAGGKPEVGQRAALESEDEIREMLLHKTKMVFVTAGMGGGTGTGAAPVIARIAKEMGILTVAIVTIPFHFEGPRRISQAREGIRELKNNVDSLLIINNEKIREMYGNLKASQAFSKADNVLTIAAKGIAELVTRPGIINVDFADVCAIMTDGGITVMGSARASGENRARNAVEEALNSPLLNNNDIAGAGRILLNIASGNDDCEVTMDEISEITDFVNCSAGKAEMIWGTAIDETLGDALSVTIVATQFPDNAEIRKPPSTRISLLPQFPEEEQVVAGEMASGRSVITVREKKSTVQEQMIWRYPDEAESAEKNNIPKLTDEHVDLEKMEKEPAIWRRQRNSTATDNAAPEQEMSRYTLSADPATNVPVIRENNAYLYDRVD
ncbi:MAG: cell division protein FtsZ [Bacteroidales bacterium]|jgi:cell division protein FtsZ|nr:cell division protein FtsZ [Bacteroidales bacterium]